MNIRGAISLLCAVVAVTTVSVVRADNPSNNSTGVVNGEDYVATYKIPPVSSSVDDDEADRSAEEGEDYIATYKNPPESDSGDVGAEADEAETEPETADEETADDDDGASNATEEVSDAQPEDDEADRSAEVGEDYIATYKSPPQSGNEAVSVPAEGPEDDLFYVEHDA